MKNRFVNQILHRGALSEGPREADIRPLQEGRAARLIEREEPPHLHEQAFIGKGVGGELVAKKTPDDLFGKDDGVQCHDQPSSFVPLMLQRDTPR